MDAAKPPAEPTPEQPANDEDALEGQNSTVESVGDSLDPGTIDATSETPAAGAPTPVPLRKPGFKQKLQRFNLYLLVFLFILMLAGAISAIAYFQSKKATTTTTLKAQALTQQTLQQVASSDATIGNAQQILNVESSAVFAGKVLIRDGLEVAGNLQIGGTVALSNITVSGTSSLGQVQISKNLSVAGDTALQGSVAIAKSLQVNGGGTFSGPLSAPQIATSGLQLNSDLVLTHHITTGGGTPNRTNGPALGSGGSASVGGSDTGGNVTINTGSNPPAGCFVTVIFTAKYNAIPHVLLTPVGSAGGGLAYYVNHDTSSFSICDASPPPAGSSFGFDYFVVD
jgi:cytoskeletal protein CcmA (bactofilin family)